MKLVSLIKTRVLKESENIFMVECLLILHIQNLDVVLTSFKQHKRF